jgi:hypothetical protein
MIESVSTGFLVTCQHLEKHPQMLEYRRAEPKTKVRRLECAASLPNLPASEAACASRNQFLGFQHLSNLGTAMQCSSSTPQTTLTPIPTLKLITHQLTTAEKDARKAQDHLQDRQEVERQLNQYKEDGVVSSDQPVDLVHFWDVSQISPLYNNTFLTLNPTRKNRWSIHTCFVSLWMSCLCRHLQFHARVHFLRGSRLQHPIEIDSIQP